MTVLLADEIKVLCEGAKPMIKPFYPSQLRPASYQLRLGKDAHVGGESKRVDIDKEIVIEPHQVAVVSTFETMRIPRNIIARWSLRVTNIYEGLLWTGGLQVDPGWEGPLFCPIYNLAERTIVLKYRVALFSMDFVRTTPDDTPRLKELKRNYDNVWFKPQRETTLAAHDKHRLHSAPYEALRQLRELRYFRNLSYAGATLIMLVLTLMVGALAVIAAAPNAKVEIPLTEALLWILLGVMALFTLVSVCFSGFVLYRLRKLL